MNQGEAVAAAAKGLIGTPFRLHGRNRQTGVDCVGLVALSMKEAGLETSIPFGYTLKNRSIDHLQHHVTQSHLAEVGGPIQPGDIVLTKVSAAQFHLLVALHETQFVHAHASLRKVVAMPAPIPWPIRAIWRHQDVF